MRVFERHTNLKYKLGNRHFFSECYDVSTVDVNTATIQKYAREQEKQDQMEDKLATWGQQVWVVVNKDKINSSMYELCIDYPKN